MGLNSARILQVNKVNCVDTNHFLGLHEFEPLIEVSTYYNKTVIKWGFQSRKGRDLLWIQMPRMSQTGSVSTIKNELRSILKQADTIADSKSFSTFALLLAVGSSDLCLRRAPSHGRLFDAIKTFVTLCSHAWGHLHPYWTGPGVFNSGVDGTEVCKASSKLTSISWSSCPLL